jgi:carbon-monoxide dehydrogenase medium subunit
MKAPPFEYAAPETVEEVVDLLAEHGEDARVLAGGQSLVPALATRILRPSVVIDLRRVDGLAAVDASDGGLELGAMVRQLALERSAVVAERCPLLPEAAGYVASIPVRVRGTIGGSLAQADSWAELPGVVAALDGELVLARRGSTREVAAQPCLAGDADAAIAPDELLTGVRLGAWPAGAGWAFEEVSRRHNGIAAAGVAVRLELDAAGSIARPRVAAVAAVAAQRRLPTVEALLDGETPSDELWASAGDAAAQAVDPPSDLHGTAAYRRHALGVLTRRALARATDRAREQEKR